MPTQERIYRDPIMDWAPNRGARSVNLLARYAEPPRLVPPSAPAQAAPAAIEPYGTWDNLTLNNSGVGYPSFGPNDPAFRASMLSGRYEADSDNPGGLYGSQLGGIQFGVNEFDISGYGSRAGAHYVPFQYQGPMREEVMGGDSGVNLVPTNQADYDAALEAYLRNPSMTVNRRVQGGDDKYAYEQAGYRLEPDASGAMRMVRTGEWTPYQEARSSDAFRDLAIFAAVAATMGTAASAIGGAGLGGAGGAAGGGGAFLGEGVASGVGAWDAAAGLGAAGGGAGGIGAAGGSLGSLGPSAGSGVINTGIGDAIGAASAQGAGSGALGAGGLSSAEAAALYGSAGYGPGMTGLQTTIYDGAINAGLGGGVANAASNVTGGIQGAANALGGSSSGNSLLGGLGGNGNLLNLGGNLLSGYMQSRAADRASDAQVAAAQEANALQRYMYDTTRADFAPWREQGVWGLEQQRNLLEDPSAITRDPSYAFGRDEGRRTYEGGAAARGGLFSGATLKALERYGQDYAGTKLNEAYNRYAGLSGTGQQATRDVAGAGQNYANNASQNMLAAGNARGAGYVGQNNAWAGAISNMLNNYQQQQLLNRLFPGG